MRFGSLYLILLLLSVIWLPAQADELPGATLDSFHTAAAEADEPAYLAQLTTEIVFLGTDGTERWEGQAFRDFVSDNFSRGRGWTYRSSQREIRLSPDGQVAWFDELLQHDQLGQCRGSGVLVRDDGDWKIAQYNLSVPIPNEMVMSVAQEIQQGPSTSEISAEIDEPVEAPPGETKCRKKRHKTNTKAKC